MEQKPRGAVLSRRGFLKAAAATGAAGFAGASLTGIAASAAQAEPVASETLGFTYHNEHCLCNCMLQCTVRDGRLAMIQPRENEDKRFQNVCLKGISEVQNIYGDARIQRPMKRVGERGKRRVRGHQLGRGLPDDRRELQGHSGQVWQGGAVDPVLHGGLPALPTTFGQRARRSGRWLERLRHGSGQWPDHGVLALDRHVRAEYYVGVARGQRGHFSQHQSGGNESHLVARHA